MGLDLGSLGSRSVSLLLKIEKNSLHCLHCKIIENLVFMAWLRFYFLNAMAVCKIDKNVNSLPKKIIRVYVRHLLQFHLALLYKHKPDSKFRRLNLT